nr:dihydrodipicolinate reductase [Rickettsiella massiliensis]
MAIRVLVNGAGGRMGSTTVKAIQQAQDLLLVQETHHTDDLKKAIQSSKADVVVDFTNSEVVFANTKKLLPPERGR